METFVASVAGCNCLFAGLSKATAWAPDGGLSRRADSAVDVWASNHTPLHVQPKHTDGL